MKRILLSIFTCVAIGAVSNAQNVVIPDANFKSFLLNSEINSNGDNEIQLSEAQSFNGDMNCSYQNISDLTGIEAFTSLNALFCFANSITSLDLSNNTSLTKLNCKENHTLSSLNIANGNNHNISFFRASTTSLTCVTVDDAQYSNDNWVSDGLSYEFDSGLTFSENCNPSASIEDLNSIEISIYPNPTNHLLNIESNEILDKIEVLNVLGQKMISTKENTINVGELQSGVYFVKMTSAKGVVTRQFVKK